MVEILNFASRNKRMKLSICPAFDATGEASISGVVKSEMITIVDSRWIRFKFTNHTGSAWTVKAYWAPSSQVGNGYIPVLANGSQDTGGTSWTAVTFNGAGADLPPESNPGGSTTTLSVPANTETVWSDWMPGDGLLARTDGGAATDRLIMLRCQGTVGSPTAIQAASGLLTDSLGSSARFSSNTNITAGLTVDDFAANAYHHCTEVQVMANVAGYTVLYCGSSVLAGTTTTNDRLSFVRTACKTIQSAYGVPIIPVWNRITGTPTHSVITAAALKQIAALKPDVVAIQVANRNDTISAAQQDTNWRYVMEMVDATQRNGGVPILVTAPPWPAAQAPTSVEDGYRQINNNRARTCGLPCFDFDALMTDGGSPARIQAQWNDSGDLTHPGNTGQAYAGAQFVPTLQMALFF